MTFGFSRVTFGFSRVRSSFDYVIRDLEIRMLTVKVFWRRTS